MKIRFLSASAFAITLGLLCEATAASADNNPSNQWAGSWQDPDGGIIVVRQQNAFLDVAGKDDYSIYRSVCIIDKMSKSAKCLGDGIQFKTGKRFLYRALWMVKNGQIIERWFADFGDGLLQEGELVFTKLPVNH